ncbi:MAG: M48 family metallopeptidase [Rhodospirillaceae bacterium]|nr:M48 family metallopeptidase [Rhodospirillaceae bacterium]
MNRLGLFMVLALLAGCAQAPVTGREQLIIVPQDQVAAAGAQASQEVIKEKGIAHDPRLEAVIQRVGPRVAQASDAPNLDWRFVLIDDDTPNAFALPGGFVGVNRGLFKLVDSDAELAAVLGHEIGHVAARHHAERLSRQALVETGLSAVSGQVSPQLAPLLAQAATLGVVLPFSREQEAEADHIGLIYMARAGYDPHAAVTVWQKFESVGGAPPEFLSTHPSPGNRVQELNALMPEAMQVYRSRAAS